ncbi:MAG: helix-turn-helix transcriptional regulator [Oscillospiraceae bacterium]|nr:helix-turn-helix transcriptional regulator [Oscillospiraceae bacterium]
MPFSYNRLWKLLIDENMTKTDFRNAVGISTNTLAKMGRNENVAFDVLDRICVLFDCKVEDVMEHIK